MSLRDELLTPIAGPNPGGVDLRYDPLYDKIKEARREDDDAPQGDWATERKTADWPTVIRLAKEALATKTKDLQLAAWLTDALVRREGFAGLTSGLELLEGLVADYWETLFPEIDDGDAEMRAAPLEWIAIKLDTPIRLVALDKKGFDSLKYKEARLVPSEETANETREKADARKAAIAAGKPTPEDLDAAFVATPKAWFKALVADIQSSLGALAKLDETAGEKFGNVAPSFGRLRETIEGVQHAVSLLLKRKLELEPDPIEEIAPAAAAADAGGDASSDAGAATGAKSAGGPLAAEPTSRDDAASRIVSAARFIRQSDPYNPASYLILRGFRWGELRVGGSGLDPKLLEAPATSVRTKLKGLLLDAKWAELLEMAEGVMGTPQGRGWLDLQRYVFTACDALGGEYQPAATAMRGALRALLTDLPQLVDMTMMDDTPTANAETRAWLRARIQVADDASSSEIAAERVADLEEVHGRDPFSLASAEVRAGHADRAISLLMREVARQKTTRARFLTQVQLAHIMVDAGHDAVATPVLEQLLADIEAHKLEEWEAGDVVAAPLALMYRALGRTEGDESTRQALYLRICRLDPLQAISFTQQQ